MDGDGAIIRTQEKICLQETIACVIQGRADLCWCISSSGGFRSEHGEHWSVDASVCVRSRIAV